MSHKNLQGMHLAQGRNAEALFCEVTGAEKGSQDEDFRHIDVWLDGETVDVKMVKHSTGQGYILVEFSNVQGKKGWCSDVGADWIAFQDDGKFLMVRTKKLYNLAMRLVMMDASQVVVKRESRAHRKYGYGHCKYKMWGRANRKDAFTYITKEDLMKVVEKEYVIR